MNEKDIIDCFLTVEELVRAYPISVICGYSFSSSDKDFLNIALRLHPFILRQGRFYHNFYHFSPEDILKEDFSTARLQRIFHNLEVVHDTFSELYETSQKLQRIYNNMIVGVLVHTIDRDILDFNEAFLNMVGYSAEEIRGKNTSIFYKERKHYEGVGEERLKQLFEKGFIDHEIEWLRKDGRKIWVKLFTKPLDKENIEEGLFSVVVDITKEKRALEALENERNQLLSIFDSIDSIIYISDPFTHEILYANKYTKELFGKDLVGKLCYVELQGKDQPCEFCTNEIILKLAGKPYKWTYYNPILKRYYEIIDRIITWTDERPARFEIAIDITDVIKAEEEKAELQRQINQLQKLEAIGRLAGGIAHDFNNILVAIRGNAQLALMKMHDDDPLRTRIEAIIEASDKAAALTRKILAFSRKQDFELRIVNINEVIAELKRMIERLMGEDIELHFDLYGEPLAVKCDISQIEQVIMNLAVNARDAMPNGGKLTIKTSAVTLTDEYVSAHIGAKTGNYALIEVSDTGVGMSKEVMEKCFEPFFTTKQGGTGLGLATVYGIVKQHNGNIWVYSEEGKGTTFKIYLPLTEGQSEKLKSLHNAQEIPKGKETVFVVEDNNETRIVTSEMLRNLGYKVYEAKDAEEALSIFKEKANEIDIILTDVVMPKMSGVELVKAIRKISPRAKVLYMSGYSQEQLNLHVGELYLLKKPFTLQELAQKLRTVLD
ncbi:ATP-binding protein [Thermodesulfovibrio hydrogeniphilus]